MHSRWGRALHSPFAGPGNTAHSTAVRSRPAPPDNTRAARTHCASNRPRPTGPPTSPPKRCVSPSSRSHFHDHRSCATPGKDGSDNRSRSFRQGQCFTRNAEFRRANHRVTESTEKNTERRKKAEKERENPFAYFSFSFLYPLSSILCIFFSVLSVTLWFALRRKSCPSRKLASRNCT